jgi:hypothetical protein
VDVSRLYDDLPTFLKTRGIEAEDSFDYGVWWWDGEPAASNQYRLTWIGKNRRDKTHEPGELYAVCLQPASVTPFLMEETPGVIVSAGAAAGVVEFFGTIPVNTEPIPGRRDIWSGEAYQAHHAEHVLEGWEDACGAAFGIQWVRGRIAWAAERGLAALPTM